MIIDRAQLNNQIVSKYGQCYWDELFPDRHSFMEWLHTKSPDMHIALEWFEFGVHLIEIKDDYVNVEIVAIHGV